MPAPIPQPMDSDHEDVHWALSTATSLQAQGDVVEALRWVRKAISAAVANGHKARAQELSRAAARVEASLSGALTQRVSAFEDEATALDDTALAHSAVAQSAMARAASAQSLDAPGPTLLDESTVASAVGNYDLDQPTFVDSSPRRHIAAAARTLLEGTAPTSDGEITLVPFTKKAASVTAVSRIPDQAGYARQKLPGADTIAMDDHADAAGDELDPANASTVAMRVPPNVDDISDLDSIGDAPISETARAMTAVPKHRVALLASPDGHDPRVMLLRDGMAAPPGAGLAYLIPASSGDASRVGQLLDVGRKKKNE